MGSLRGMTAAALGSLLLTAALTAGCSLLPAEGLTAVINPAIRPSGGADGFVSVERSFDFEQVPTRITVPVDSAVYEGATQAQKSAIFIGGDEPADWTSDYYRAFISEKHQDRFYASLVEALRSASSQRGLDSSRYVELVIAMAQSLEYRIDPGDLAPKFPIETFADGFGDCDDKTLLAAGILSREGYDVAILLFGPEEHVAMGIRAPGLDYAGTGYAYVEMSSPSMVGIVPKQLTGGIVLESKPEVIRIGEGGRTFDAGDRIAYISDALRRLEAKRSALGDRIQADKSRLDDRRTGLEADKRSLDGGSPSMADITAFNSRVAEYNRLVEKLDADIDRYNSLNETLRFAAENPAARPQVDLRLRQMGF